MKKNSAGGQSGELCHGLHWLVAALFIVADMAGAGIVALPRTVIDTGFYPGMVLIVVMGFVGAGSAIFLGKAWVILLRCYPEYQSHCRGPYSEIGYRACGFTMRWVVAQLLNITQFGIGTSFLLLIATSSSEILATYKIAHVSFCTMILIVAVALIPVLMLKSPNDFWPVVVAGSSSTIIAVALIFAGAFLDARKYGACAGLASLPLIQPKEVFLSLGVVLFTFGGHSALPTVQHDMRYPRQFTQSSIVAFIIIALMNLIVAGLAGMVYGNSVQATIVTSIETMWLRTLVNLMILLHCLLTFPLMVNPLNQQIEEIFKITHEFGLKRVAIRLALLSLITIVALVMPSFRNVMSLLGGSTLTVLSLIFPPIFYLRLSVGERKLRAAAVRVVASQKIMPPSSDSASDSLKSAQIGADASGAIARIRLAEIIRMTDPKILAACLAICLTGILGGSIATVEAIRHIVTDVNDKNTPICFVG